MCLCSLGDLLSSGQRKKEVRYDPAGDTEFVPGGGILRVMERVKFNSVIISLGHCMVNLDSNARDYRESKCEQICLIQY